VTVRYQDVRGVPTRMRLTDFAATVFQHEFDHLQGVLFHDRMSPSERQRIAPDLAAMKAAYERQQSSR
jgi:peptide deformylase